MSYEDSFEREAADQRAYEFFESWYIFENLQPHDIGNWEWLLMFDRCPSYSTYPAAAFAAREIVRELKKPVKVQSLYEGCFIARPEDYYKFPKGSFWTTYASKRADFIKVLVIAARYPDLVRIANESRESDRYSISRHYLNEVKKVHQLWIQVAVQAGHS